MVGDANPGQISTTSSPREHHHAATLTMKILQSIRHSAINWKPLYCHLTATLQNVVNDHFNATWMPIGCHFDVTSPMGSPPYCQWVTTELANTSPLDCQSNTHSLGIILRSTAEANPQPMYIHSANLMPLRLPRDNHSIYQSIVNPVLFDCHCVATQSIQFNSDQITTNG